MQKNAFHDENAEITMKNGTKQIGGILKNRMSRKWRKKEIKFVHFSNLTDPEKYAIIIKLSHEQSETAKMPQDEPKRKNKIFQKKA